MKIIGVGLSKTATSSLARALGSLGYEVAHYPRDLSVLDRCDGGCDITVAERFDELDRKYPGSRFIYTTRDLGDWLESCRIHFNFRGVDEDPFAREVRRRVYGTEGFDEDRFRDTWATHDARVRTYFADRPGDLLEIDICAGEGWEALCSFLGHPVPDRPFPRANVRPPLKARIRQRLSRLLGR
jgi:hypothetical protein